MKDDILRWWMTVKYHHQFQDSRQLSIHISQIQQWDFHVSASWLTPGKSLLGTTTATMLKAFVRAPSSLVTARLGKLWLIWPTVFMLLTQAPVWTCQTSSQWHHREFSCQMLSFLELSIFAGHRRQLKREENIFIGSPSNLCPVRLYLEWIKTLGSRLSFHLYTGLHNCYLI